MGSNLRDKVESFIKSNKLKAYKSNEQWVLPYKSDKCKLYLFIRLNGEENLGLKMGFRARVYSDSPEFTEKLRETLLDLNSRLVMGALALKKDSNTVEFSLDYTVASEESIGWKQYNRYVMFCMNVCEDLMERKLIKESILDE